jgi:hypothetical protein
MKVAKNRPPPSLCRQFSEKGSYPPIALYISCLVTFFFGPLEKKSNQDLGSLSTHIKCGNYFVEKYKVTFLCGFK